MILKVNAYFDRVDRVDQRLIVRRFLWGGRPPRPRRRGADFVSVAVDSQPGMQIHTFNKLK